MRHYTEYMKLLGKEHCKVNAGSKPHTDQKGTTEKLTLSLTKRKL